jgi:hypothetical protein
MKAVTKSSRSDMLSWRELTIPAAGIHGTEFAPAR